MPLDRSPAAAGSPLRGRPSGRYALLPDVGRQAGRAMVATLAGAIAVLGSVAGSAAFVMQSMKSAQDMSVSVAPVITLRPAAPKAAARSTVSAAKGSIATQAPSIPAGTVAQLAATALQPLATPALTGRLLAAAQAPAAIHRSASSVTGAASLAAGAVALPSTIPVVARPRVAKVPTVPSLDLVTPPPRVAPLAVSVAHGRVHLARARARAGTAVSPAPRATVALSQIDSARKIQGGGHRLWAEPDGLNGPSTHH